jgi:hypothetical protein
MQDKCLPWFLVIFLRLYEVKELFSIHLTLPAVRGPGVYSAYNRNEYQKQKNVSGE